MNHLLIEGGGQYLPFALSQARRMRSIGLQTGSRNWDFGDAQLHLRILGDETWVYLSAAGLFAYASTPTITSSAGRHREPLPPADVAEYVPPDLPTEPVFTFEDPPLWPDGSNGGNAYSFTGDSATFHIIVYSGPSLNVVGFWDVVGDSGGSTTVLHNVASLIFIAGEVSPGLFKCAWVPSNVEQTIVYTLDGEGNATLVSDVSVPLTIDPDAPPTNDYADWLARRDAAYAAFMAGPHADWVAECDALVAAAMAAQGDAQSGICATWTPGVTGQRQDNRALQLVSVANEVAQGIRTGYVAQAVLTLPEVPALSHTVPLPIREVSRTGATGSETITYEITDYSQDPPTTRQVIGTVTSTSEAGNTDSCGVAVSTFHLTNCWVGGLPAAISPDMVPWPDSLEGYFVSGAVPPSQPWLASGLTFTVPAEYRTYLALKMAPAGTVDTPVYLNDAFAPPSASLVVFELECFDRYTGLWTWTTAPSLLDTDPVRQCELSVCGLPTLPAAAVPRAIRFKQLLRHKRILGTWSTALAVETEAALNVTLPFPAVLPTLVLVSQSAVRSIAPLEPDPNDAILYPGATSLAQLAEVDATPWAGLDTEEKLRQKLVITAARIAGVPLNFTEPPP